MVGTIYDELVKLISNVGFPAAVSIYLLVRLDKRLEDLTKDLSKLTNAILTVVEHQKSEELIKK
ncbi:YvrJ family protein [Clostridium tyrobutyricum]|uniref:YvrJ family protein n=1 Tax=Clostridium tyrobutyricum TaxID=1519 RepID=UPI00242D2520|nr:YvrJ family protein [Clostridium tyrobutyricum]